jgi:NitT/TauT family transport system ATP-binding protein
MPVVSVQGLYKTFKRDNDDQLNVLRDINFDVAQGEFTGLIGYSGCGKTTLLRIICGFERAEGGFVLIDGLKHEKPGRNVLMLFQDFNQLFPWKTVLQNVMHPLIATGFIRDKAAARSRAEKRLHDVGLSDFLQYYPHQLSGGMMQRAAVARALALQPRVLLMDEPFASLDNITRRTLQELTRRVCDKYGVTVIFVTHSVEESVIMADKIIVMREKPGQINAVIENTGRAGYNEAGRAVIIEQIMRLLDESKKAD